MRIRNVIQQCKCTSYPNETSMRPRQLSSSIALHPVYFSISEHSSGHSANVFSEAVLSLPHPCITFVQMWTADQFHFPYKSYQTAQHTVFLPSWKFTFAQIFTTAGFHVTSPSFYVGKPIFFSASIFKINSTRGKKKEKLYRWGGCRQSWGHMQSRIKCVEERRAVLKDAVGSAPYRIRLTAHCNIWCMCLFTQTVPMLSLLLLTQQDHSASPDWRAWVTVALLRKKTEANSVNEPC